MFRSISACVSLAKLLVSLQSSRYGLVAKKYLCSRTGLVAMALECSKCCLSGGDDAGGVHTGLDASEMVVRGGRLSEPSLFSNLIVGSDGKRFLRLRKTHDGLCRFLTGKGSWTRPLAATAVFETLRVWRNEMVAALVAESFDGVGAEVAPGADGDEEDPMALLGIDDAAAFEPGCQAGPTRAIKRMRQGSALQWGSTAVSVGLEPGFQFSVLAEPSYSVPAIELTASSLWSLYRLVNRDLESVARPPKRVKARRQGGASVKEPRGPRGKREYWDEGKQRWVQKERQPDGKYRVLTRRATPVADGGLGASAENLDDGTSEQASSPVAPLGPEGVEASTDLLVAFPHSPQYFPDHSPSRANPSSPPISPPRGSVEEPLSPRGPALDPFGPGMGPLGPLFPPSPFRNPASDDPGSDPTS